MVNIDSSCLAVKLHLASLPCLQESLLEHGARGFVRRMSMGPTSYPDLHRFQNGGG